ncbi:MAG TPA: hypothetical protein VMK83_04115 [Gaiellaceae bacterium]|nr:hypothetical protein [Gaiellaceae bacterium]
MSERPASTVDRGDLKSTTYEFFMLAIARGRDHRDSSWTDRQPDHADLRRRSLHDVLRLPRDEVSVTPEAEARETTPELSEIRALLDRQEETMALLCAKLERLEAMR